MNTIYVFGNPTDIHDRAALSVLPYLKNNFPDIVFIEADPTEEWLVHGTDIIILDTVHGISEPKLYTDLSEFSRSCRTSVHDFDLPISLGLMLKTKRVNSVTIIGVPETGINQRIRSKLASILTDIFNQT